MQHTALNHAWLAAVVCGGWGMLLTTWRPSASSRRLNLPYHAPSPCFPLPPPFSPPTGLPRAFPLAHAVLPHLRAVLRLLREAAAGAAGGGGGVCVWGTRGRVATSCMCVDHLRGPLLEPQVQVGSSRWCIGIKCIGYGRHGRDGMWEPYRSPPRAWGLRYGAATAACLSVVCRRTSCTVVDSLRALGAWFVGS